MQRVGIFIDSANYFYAQKNLGWWIDWKKLLAFLSKDKLLYNAFYYTAQAPESLRNEESFHAYLTFSGYTVKKKLLRRVYDANGDQIGERANCDVEMTIDMLTTSELYDEAVICSGDRDFEAVLHYLRSKGKHLTVLSEPRSIALELRNGADHYLDLVTLKETIERSDRRPDVVAWEQGGRHDED